MWKFENNRVSWEGDYQYTSCVLTDDQIAFAKKQTNGKSFMDFAWCSHEYQHTPDGGLLNIYFKTFGPDLKELRLRTQLAKETNTREQNFIWEIKPPKEVYREPTRRKR